MLVRRASGSARQYSSVYEWCEAHAYGSVAFRGRCVGDMCCVHVVVYSGSPVNTYVEKIGGTAILAGLLTPWLHQASPEWFHIEPSALRHRLFHGLHFGYFCGIILPIQLSIFIFIYLSRCRSETAARMAVAQTG
jgi:hypothetical protein